MAVTVPVDPSIRTRGLKRVEFERLVELGLLEGERSEPDLAVTDDPGPAASPTTAHLVIEVAETSQRLDLGEKASRYAAANVPQYWVIDLPRREVIVHTSPREGRYDRIERMSPTTLRVLDVEVDLAAILAQLPR